MFLRIQIIDTANAIKKGLPFYNVKLDCEGAFNIVYIVFNGFLYLKTSFVDNRTCWLFLRTKNRVSLFLFHINIRKE